jgi:hypothetical protein
MLVSYHKETISKSELTKSYSSEMLYEKKTEKVEINDPLSVLLESQKVMDFSKFRINHN